jgi:hypothetical protein
MKAQIAIHSRTNVETARLGARPLRCDCLPAAIGHERRRGVSDCNHTR